jgi:hypothetical protein
MSPLIAPNPNEDDDDDWERQPSALSNLALGIAVWGGLILVVVVIWHVLVMR